MAKPKILNRFQETVDKLYKKISPIPGAEAWLQSLELRLYRLDEELKQLLLKGVSFVELEEWVMAQHLSIQLKENEHYGAVFYIGLNPHLLNLNNAVWVIKPGNSLRKAFAQLDTFEAKAQFLEDNMLRVRFKANVYTRNEETHLWCFYLKKNKPIHRPLAAGDSRDTKV